MNGKVHTAIAITHLATELIAAGIDIKRLIEVAEANGGELPEAEKERLQEQWSQTFEAWKNA